MKYGLIGEKLGHSYSRDIHTSLGNKEYTLCEVAKENIDRFMTDADFLGINVTIPYKETVIPYLSHIDSAAREIGAVNTVVNKDGHLLGYNTDAFGMEKLILHAGVSINGRKVAILGTGGTSKTAYHVVKKMGAREIIRVTRGKRDGAVSYDDLYDSYNDVEVVINTTPSGMYPNTNTSPIDLSRLGAVCGVIDAVYNPIRTKLILDAERRGIAAEGGLYMLVAQAVRASEIFLETEYNEKTIEKIYRDIKAKKENIVLTGMPSSGKSTIGRLISKAYARPFIDTDEIIKEKAGMEIPEIFEKHGEEKFREIESEVIEEVSLTCGAVIATGGGAVLKNDNVENLKKNGRVFFIDRSPELLTPTSDRPLSQNTEAIMKRYSERYPIYCGTADIKTDGDGTAKDVAESIMESFNK